MLDRFSGGELPIEGYYCRIWAGVGFSVESHEQNCDICLFIVRIPRIPLTSDKIDFLCSVYEIFEQIKLFFETILSDLK